jgi:hypothetical protein
MSGIYSVKDHDILGKWKSTLLAELTELAAVASPPVSAHKRADSILCELLVQLGCEEIVSAYEKVGKWYA